MAAGNNSIIQQTILGIILLAERVQWAHAQGGGTTQKRMQPSRKQMFFSWGDTRKAAIHSIQISVARGPLFSEGT
jgi:hypothetical protein